MQNTHVPNFISFHLSCLSMTDNILGRGLLSDILMCYFIILNYQKLHVGTN